MSIDGKVWGCNLSCTHVCSGWFVARDQLPACQLCRERTCASPVPAEDVKIEVAVENDIKQIMYDDATKTVRIPLATLQSDVAQRRTKMVLFTCNKCGECSPHVEQNPCRSAFR